MAIGNRFNKRQAQRTLNMTDDLIYHPTYFDPYLLPHLGKTPYVVTVHDMIHELFPNQVADPETSLKKSYMIERADHIIVVSHSTKGDLLDIFPHVEEKVSVIHHGVDFQRNAAGDIPLVSDPYLLFVGSRLGYKNFPLLAKAFASIASDFSQLRLVCVGGGMFTAHELKMFEDLDIAHRVDQIHASDEQLRNLYQNAEAFIFPSRYEGFGLPVLEAMALGTPCVLSNASSLREVGGNAALYFNPEDSDELKDLLERILCEKTLVAELRNAGLKRASQFTWEKSASLHEEVYRTL